MKVQYSNCLWCYKYFSECCFQRFAVNMQNCAFKLCFSLRWPEIFTDQKESLPFIYFVLIILNYFVHC